jgi:hypothetical protein
MDEACDSVDVRKFGAKGDDVTDDSAAFQAAVDSLNSQKRCRAKQKMPRPGRARRSAHPSQRAPYGPRKSRLCSAAVIGRTKSAAMPPGTPDRSKIVGALRSTHHRRGCRNVPNDASGALRWRPNQAHARTLAAY